MQIAFINIIVLVITVIVLLNTIVKTDASVDVKQVFLNGAIKPPCVNDLNNLPIFELRARMSVGESFRGTTFLIDDTHWITAAHVVKGKIESLSIYTGNGVVNGKLVYYDEVADVAVIKTPLVSDYDPIDVKKDEAFFLDDVWNVGYPGWAADKKVISSGKVIGYSEGMIFTNASVMTGMSGGPTLSCNGDSLEANGVISLFSKELLSVRKVKNADDGRMEIEKTYINTGESFSAILNRVNYNNWLNYNNSQ